MIKIILWRLGMLQKYSIEYNELFTNSKNQTIDFFYYKISNLLLVYDHIIHFHLIKF